MGDKAERINALLNAALYTVPTVAGSLAGGGYGLRAGQTLNAGLASVTPDFLHPPDVIADGVTLFPAGVGSMLGGGLGALAGSGAVLAKMALMGR